MVSFTDDAAHNGYPNTRQCGMASSHEAHPWIIGRGQQRWCQGVAAASVQDDEHCLGTDFHEPHVWGKQHEHRCKGYRLTPEDILAAPRVRWKYNFEERWRYGKAVAYTDKPSFIIQDEEDGVSRGVLAEFHPEPVPEDTLLTQIEQVISAYDAEHPMADPIAETELAQRLRAALGDQA